MGEEDQHLESLDVSPQGPAPSGRAEAAMRPRAPNPPASVTAWGACEEESLWWVFMPYPAQRISSGSSHPDPTPTSMRPCLHVRPAPRLWAPKPGLQVQTFESPAVLSKEESSCLSLLSPHLVFSVKHLNSYLNSYTSQKTAPSTSSWELARLQNPSWGS